MKKGDYIAVPGGAVETVREVRGCQIFTHRANTWYHPSRVSRVNPVDVSQMLADLPEGATPAGNRTSLPDCFTIFDGNLVLWYNMGRDTRVIKRFYHPYEELPAWGDRAVALGELYQVLCNYLVRDIGFYSPYEYKGFESPGTVFVETYADGDTKLHAVRWAIETRGPEKPRSGYYDTGTARLTFAEFVQYADRVYVDDTPADPRVPCGGAYSENE